MRNNDFSQNTGNSIRIEHELSQGRKIKENAENVWGWASPAGKIRASRRAQYFLKLTNMNSDCDVLKIGCGTGIFTEKVAKSGARIAATDLSENLLEFAKRKIFLIVQLKLQMLIN